MPRYHAQVIEPKWQNYWEENATFATPEFPGSAGKLYALDMFPYPSGDGLHVGHPEGYTATDIVSRFERMRGKSVLHPMGFDSFGLPAEEHAIRTNTPPRVGTEKNIATFRRQLKMLGFSYDWGRELATTDVEYFKWTQWIFTVIFDTWFDPVSGKGRPISELPIPDDIAARGKAEVRYYQDEHRLAYQSDALVNWCPALGTVLANEEVIDGKSERGAHPVERRPLRQWMLRITAYADRLEKDLDGLDWSESIKLLQRNWIGRSTGAEVDFYIGSEPFSRRRNDDGDPAFESWQRERARSGFPRKPGDDSLRVYTTRPDTLFGATYMVLAPEHPFVQRLATLAQRQEVEAYIATATAKSDQDRQDVKREKTGVFTGSFAINPVNGEAIPIWIADYVLISYGSGAIMAVPAHDERDFEFAQKFGIEIKAVVRPPDEWFEDLISRGDLTPEMIRPFEPALRQLQDAWEPDSEFPEDDDEDDASDRAFAQGFRSLADWSLEEIGNDEIMGFEFAQTYWQFPAVFGQPYTGEGVVINSGFYSGTTSEFKRQITADLAQQGLGREAVNYKLRDWLFSRQRFWGEPFPILKELDDEGNETGFVRAVDAANLPVDLPHLDDFKPHGRPEPPLEKAPAEWLYVELGGKRYKRETNTMPQWAGSCWYYLRFIDPKNAAAFVDPAKEKAWMPVDLYIGGAEHAVLHLLYARFWHKVLYDRGHVSTPEPFQRLVNQGMILGEQEFTGYQGFSGVWVSSPLTAKHKETGEIFHKQTKESLTAVSVDPHDVQKQGDNFVLTAHPKIVVESRAYKMSKSRGNVINPDDIVHDYGADSLRLYEMFMGPLEATKPWSMDGVSGVRGFLDRAWRMIIDPSAEEMRLNDAVADIEPTDEQDRVLHRTIMAVTHDIENLSFNTAIARMMEFVNFFSRQKPRPRTAMEQFVLLLSPFAPHIAEELWQALGHENTLAYQPWPEYVEERTKEDTIEVPIQILGKLRSKIRVPADISQEDLEAAAKADKRIQELTAGKKIVKTIVVPGRLVNLVVK